MLHCAANNHDDQVSEIGNKEGEWIMNNYYEEIAIRIENKYERRDNRIRKMVTMNRTTRRIMRKGA